MNSNIIPQIKAKTRFNKSLVIKIIVYTLLAILAFAFIFPYVWLIMSSFKIPEMVKSSSLTLLPRDMNGKILFSLGNYKNALIELNFKDVIVNTLIVCVLNTVINLFLNSLAGYAFARIKFIGREFIFRIILLAMMIPGTVMMIPNYIVTVKLGLYDTLPALILPFIMSIYNVFLLRQQFYALSFELEDAAAIDGAGRFRTFFTIALPLVAPMLVVLGITTFVWNYNNYMWPLVATIPGNPRTQVLAVSLGRLMANSRDATMYPIMLAGAVLVSVPMIVIFFVLQKFIMGGIMTGGVKG